MHKRRKKRKKEGDKEEDSSQIDQLKDQGTFWLSRKRRNQGRLQSENANLGKLRIKRNPRKAVGMTASSSKRKTIGVPSTR